MSSFVARKSKITAPKGVSEIIRSDLSEGDNVTIRPQVTTSDPPVRGRLRYLSRLRVSLDHFSKPCGEVVVHLPVAGYQIQRDHRV